MAWADGDNVTSTNLNNISGLVVNVKDKTYGAVGDNSTDDTAAIQAAIDAVYDAGGGTVFIPRGDYLLSSTLSMNATSTLGCTLRGDVRRDTLLRPNASVRTVIQVGTAGSNTLYPVIQDITITGANVSAHTGCAIHGIRVQHGTFRRINIEEFDGVGGRGLYCEGDDSATAPHFYRSLFEQVVIATTDTPAYFVNADENDFISCTFGCVTGSASSHTAVEIKQGRNNRFWGLLAQGETTSLTTGRPNYIGVHLSQPAKGDNQSNQFYGVVAEGFDVGLVIDSGTTAHAIHNYNASICNSFFSDGGSDTLWMSPVHDTIRVPGGSVSSLGVAFSNDPDTGIFRVGADIGRFVAGGQVAGQWGNAYLAAVSGSAIAPSLRFTSEESLGIYRSGVSSLAVSYGTFNLNGVRLVSMRTADPADAYDNAASNEIYLGIGASNATLWFKSGNTLWEWGTSSSTSI